MSDNQAIEQSAIERCQAGDLEAFGALYDLYVKRIYDFVYYRVGHRQTAEDITSLVFTKALENINSFRSKDGFFGAWLFRIARNTIIDHSRTRKVTAELNQNMDFGSNENLERELDGRLGIERVRQYLDRLNEQQRDIVIMRLWDGLSYSEISVVTGKTEANCKVIFSRILRKMQQDLVPAVLAFLLTLNLP